MPEGNFFFKKPIQPNLRGNLRKGLNKTQKNHVIMLSLQQGSETRKMTAPSAYKESRQMKIKLILLLYDALINGETISRKKFCAEYVVSERTFYRYMQEIVSFLRAHKSSCYIDLQNEGDYFLKKND